MIRQYKRSIILKGMTTQLNRKSVVAMERIRKLVGEWSCLKWAIEMIDQ